MIIGFIAQTESFLNKPFYNAVASPLSISDFNLLLDLFRRALLILMMYRDTLQKSIDVIKCSQPTNETLSHFRMCNQQLKAIRTYDRARYYHLHSAQDMVNCIGSVPANFAFLIWDSFFESFVDLSENLVFDSCTFRIVVADAKIFIYFLNSLSNFAVQRFRKGFPVGHLLHSLQVLFDKLVSQPSAAPKSLEDIDAIHADASRLVKASKEFVSSSQYCSDILGFIRAFCQFMDYMCQSTPFSQNVLKEPFVISICQSALLVTGSSKHLVQFITFCIKKLPELLKSHQLVSALIRLLPHDPEQTLHEAAKVDKHGFYQNQTIMLLYQICLTLLNSASSQMKTSILKFLKHIPTRDYANLNSLCEQVLYRRIITLHKGDVAVELDSASFFRALGAAILASPSNQFFWDLGFEITAVRTKSDCWMPDRRMSFHSMFSLWLFFYDK
jgi:hypothetical protein